MHRTIGLIHEQGCKAGLVFNPATPLTWLDHVMDDLDMILLMSVNPGFGGQKFIDLRWPSLLRRAHSSMQAVGTYDSKSMAG